MKQKLPFLFLLLTSAGLYAQPGAAAQLPGPEAISFGRFSPENEILQSTVNCVHQDRRGFMWFGTWAGLYRYDGLHVRPFKPQKKDPHSLKGRKIRTIYEDRAGRLWIGSMDEGLHLFDRERERFVAYKHVPGNANSLSSNDVTTIAEDWEGHLWVGTSAGLNRVKRSALPAGKAAATAPALSVTRYALDGDSARRINAIHQDEGGRIWAGTETGLFLFRPQPRPGEPRFVRIPIGTGAPDFYPRNNIASLTSHRDPRTGEITLWLGTRGGLTRMVLPADGPEPVPALVHYGHRNAPFALSNNQVRTVFRQPGEEGWLWVGTEDGLNRLEVATDKFYPHRTDPDDPHSLSSNVITALYADHAGVLWIATERGLNTFDPYRRKFALYQAGTGGAKGAAGASITALAVGTGGEVWAGTQGGGLHRMRLDGPGSGQVRPYAFAGAETNVATNHVYSLCADRNGTLWVGTNGEGIYRFRPGDLQAGDKTIRRYVQYRQNYENTHGLTDNYVLTLYQDRRGTVWAGTWNGDLHAFDPAQNRFVPLEGWSGAARARFPVSALLEDHAGTLWVGTRGGGVFRLTAAAGNRFAVRHFAAGEDGNSLSNNFINCLFEDREKDLWVGTEEGLNRLDPATGACTVVDAGKGLPDPVIQGILQDPAGTLWVSTTRGIAQFHPHRLHEPGSRFWRHFSREDGLQGDVFNSNACTRTPQGLLLFGGINGMNACIPARVGRNPHPPRVAITGLSVFNQPVPIGKNGAGQTLLRRSIGETARVTLAHDENSVSLEFAALHFASPGQNEYAYRMEGFDKGWTHTHAPQNVAHYTNLDPGTYTFRVRAANNDQVWNQRGTALTLVITPPFWATGWAYLGYVLAGIALLYLLRKWVLVRAEFRHRLALERVQRENAEALHQLKLRFFTDISHEIRTPLTLITGILDQVLHGREYPPRLHHQLRVMHRNGHQLRRLINQLLDFRKHESGYLRLKATEGDLVPFLADVCQAFRELALERHIDCDLEAEPEPIRLWFDHDKLRQIVTNLLSNAFKFTPDGGQIRVKVRTVPADASVPFPARDPVPTREGWAQITVQDNGSGIAPDQLDKLFDLYYQAEAAHQPVQAGTGIGLALSKSLAELHHGGIAVTSPAGEGAVFCVYLPLGKAHLQPSEMGPEPLQSLVLDPGAPGTVPGTRLPEEFMAPSVGVPADAPLLLVVEDQPDLRAFIADLFGDKYRVLRAAHGAEGLTLATEHVPDLIISDVLMPQLDGIELCRRIKTDERTSHIPLLLLTARTDAAHQAEGLETGADDYIGKPFDGQALVLKVRNLLTLRENIRRRSGQQKFLNPREAATNAVDEAFLEKVTGIVQQHLHDPNFKVEDFTRAIGMSRVQLYRKLKALTGLAVNEFMRNQRLQRAAVLLEENQLTVAEVTYQVGFGDLKYFRACFKEHFGVNPSEYATRPCGMPQAKST